MRISYEPLRNHLESIGRSIHYLRTKGVINSNAAKQLADDVPISLRKIIEICEFLDVDDLSVILKIVRE